MKDIPLGLIAYGLILLLLSCGQNHKSGPATQVISLGRSEDPARGNLQETTSYIPAAHYFEARGTEPFWYLEISENKISLKMPGDSIITPHTLPIPAVDCNVRLYSLQTESTGIKIQIAEDSCSNAMSGKRSPYSVQLEFKRNAEETFTSLTGCGAYITDYRLHDIWVLEELNGSVTGDAGFKAGYPTLEINAASNTFSGFAGCNLINGSIFFERGLLRFNNMHNKLKLCQSSQSEGEFIRTLLSITSYRLGDNRLHLTNPSGAGLVFKKTD
jgi:uncharacterized membrane protein